MLTSKFGLKCEYQCEGAKSRVRTWYMFRDLRNDVSCAYGKLHLSPNLHGLRRHYLVRDSNQYHVGSTQCDHAPEYRRMPLVANVHGLPSNTRRSSRESSGSLLKPLLRVKYSLDNWGNPSDFQLRNVRIVESPMSRTSLTHKCKSANDVESSVSPTYKSYSSSPPPSGGTTFCCS